MLGADARQFPQERGSGSIAFYAHEGIPFTWLVDPVARTLEVYRLEAGRWVLVGAHAGAEVVRAEPFAEVELGLSALWPNPA